MLSVIIPASNEEASIAECLGAVLDSTFPAAGGAAVEVIVVANGCRDHTAERAKGFADMARARGWGLRILSLQDGDKMAALNAGDAVAQGDMRLYLDADVLISRQLLGQIEQVLSMPKPAYASGKLQISATPSRTTRAYRRIYEKLPFIARGVPGAGLFAVNAAGRARWGQFPGIISDDTFVRLQFAPDERIGVAAPYQWPLVEGLGNLVRVRRRQNAGVAEIAIKYPELLQNDDKISLGLAGVLRLAIHDPFGFLVYAGVALMVKLTPQQGDAWGRGR